MPWFHNLKMILHPSSSGTARKTIQYTNIPIKQAEDSNVSIIIVLMSSVFRCVKLFSRLSVKRRFGGTCKDLQG
jgi:hypothetical protein